MEKRSKPFKQVGLTFFVILFALFLLPNLFIQKNKTVLQVDELSVQKNDSAFNLDREISELDESNMGFNAPKQLLLYEEHPVVLLVSNGLSKQKLEQEIKLILGPRNLDSIEVHRIKTNTLIESKLTGTDFSIEYGSPDRQPISEKTFTTWEWTIKPEMPGNKTLTLSINIILNVNGKEEKFNIETFRKQINVKVENSFWYWVKENETIILAILGFIFAIFTTYFSYFLGQKSAKETNELEEKSDAKKN